MQTCITEWSISGHAKSRFCPACRQHVVLAVKSLGFRIYGSAALIQALWSGLQVQSRIALTYAAYAAQGCAGCTAVPCNIRPSIVCLVCYNSDVSWVRTLRSSTVVGCAFCSSNSRNRPDHFVGLFGLDGGFRTRSHVTIETLRFAVPTLASSQLSGA